MIKIKNIMITILLLTISVMANDIKIISQNKSLNNSMELVIKAKNINNSSTIIKYPNKDIKTATVFLIDTSVPMRKAFINGIKPILKNLYTLKSEFDEFCITQFDADLKIVKDFNSVDLNNTLNNIKIKGQRTELYRASLEAIKLLKTKDGYIKYLVILSDGKFEDNSYKYEDVIKEAKKQNTIILSIGYKDSIHLQSIRRLAEESGGQLWIANKTTHKLPLNFESEFMSYFQNLALLKIDEDTIKPNLKGKVDLQIKVTDEINQTTTKIITISVKKIEDNSEILYVGIGVFSLIVLIFISIRKRKKEKIIKKDPIGYFKTTAGEKLNIYKKYSTIGAVMDNDIVISGDLISRYHAVLDFKDDKFYIIDRNSTNGVFVNYKRISQQELNDNDIVLFGPYEVIFKIVYTKCN